MSAIELVDGDYGCVRVIYDTRDLEAREQIFINFKLLFTCARNDLA